MGAGHGEFGPDDDLFEQVVPELVEHGLVLRRSSGGKVEAMICIEDAVPYLQAIAEMHVLVTEIELHLRALFGARLDTADMASFMPRWATSVTPDALDFGAYCRMLEDIGIWSKLNLGDRHQETFVTRLREVKGFRNRIMHLDPEPLADEDVEKLRAFKSYLRRLLQRIGT